MLRVYRQLALAALVVVACGGGEETTQKGEVLLFIDTDMPVPQFVARLRVDLFDANGVWFASRDFERAQSSGWPASFGVFSEGGDERVVTVRLRAFPENATRDYRGERFVRRPDPAASKTTAALKASTPPAATNEPRLVIDGVDSTPPTEPQPMLAIDRLVRLRVPRSERKAAHVVLRGRCVGTMANVAESTSCIEQEGVLAPVQELALDDDRSPKVTVVGSFNPKGDCTAPARAGGGPPLFDDQVCIPGAMYRFGTPDGVLTDNSALPERVVILDPFLIDRYELTVARFRAALALGFVGPDRTPIGIEADAPADPTPPLDPAAHCAMSSQPRGREEYPLNCISWKAAHALCNFLGGDLPTEAQWEYVAAVAGRPNRTRFPWAGPNDLRPTCARAIFGRSGFTVDSTFLCRPEYGPDRVNARVGPEGDETPAPFGIVGLGGGLAEFTRDALAPYTAPCWTSSSLRNPVCAVGDEVDRHTSRGGSWFDDEGGLVIGVRRTVPLASDGHGLRCVYPAGVSK